MGSLTSGIQLAPLSVDIRANYGSFKSDMASVSSIGATTASQLSKTFSSMTSVGNAISGVGSTLTKSVTVPLVAAGTACTKMAMSFDTNFAKVSTLLDKGTVDYAKYKQSILENSTKMGTAVGEYSEAVYQALSASVDQGHAIEFTNNAIKLAKSGFTDAASAVDILTTCINAYSMSADDATSISDKLILTQNLGKTTVNELASTMGSVIPTAKSFGVNIDQVCASIAQMTKNGISTAESVTYLNGMLNELGSAGTDASEALKKKTGKTFVELMNSGMKLTDVIKILQESAKENKVALNDMFGNIRAGKGALTLAKDEGSDFNNILQQMTNSAGTTDTAFKKVADTTEARLKKKLNELKNQGIEIGEKLIPLAEKGIQFIGKLADKFNGLSDSQQENLLKWSALAIAAGPFLKILGGGISTIGTIGTKLISLSGALKTTTAATSALGTASSVASGASGLGALAGGLGTIASVALPVTLAFGAIAGTIYAVHENNELLNTSLNTTVEELSPLQRLWNDMDGGIIKTREEMEKLGLIHHEWSDNVAPETQEAINKTAKAWQDMNLEIKNSEVNNLTIDPSTAQRLQQQTNNVCNTIVQEIKNKQLEANKSLGEYFNVDNSLDYMEQSLLSFFDRSSLAQQQKVIECKDKINAIYQKASDEHRAITNAEVTQIGQLQQEMSNIQIDTLAKANEEKLELQAEFNVKMRNIDMQGASELMKQKAQERDDNIAKDTEYYDKKIELLSSNMHNMNQTQQIAAQEQINKLKDEKEKKLQIDRETYDGYLKTIEEKYPEIADRIDLYTGKMLSNEEYRMKKSLEDMTSHYYGINDITESGMQRLYNTETKTWNDVYLNVDENTGKISGAWNKTTGDIEACSNDVANKLSNLTSNYNNFTEGQKNDLLACISSNNSYDANTKAIASSVIGQLQGVGSTINGVYTETINCNGTPVRVQVDKYGTINNLQEIINKIRSVPTAIPVEFQVQYVNTDTGETWTGDRRTSNGRGGYFNYNGEDYVPYDGYYARLHKGERVMTAEENKAYTENLQRGSNNGITVNFNGNYNFNNKNDIDYMLNQAAIRIKGARG